MKIAFEKLYGFDPINGLIAWRTDADLVHCELLFQSGDTFSAELGVGTRFTDGSKIRLHPEYWRIVDLGPSIDELKVRQWCEKHNLAKYSIEDCFAIFFNIPDCRTDKRWICSAVCCAALQQTHGLWPFVTAAAVTPIDYFLVSMGWAEGKIGTISS